MNGGDKFIYDRVTRQIIKQDKYILDFDFNEELINKEWLDGIIENKLKPLKSNDIHSQIREQFGITKKTIKKKDLDEIAKYKQSMKNK